MNEVKKRTPRGGEKENMRENIQKQKQKLTLSQSNHDPPHIVTMNEGKG
jgi:hypothetical protein